MHILLGEDKVVRGRASKQSLRIIINSGERSQQGFTLIELLTVVTILGVLAAIAVPTVSRAKTRAIVTAAKQNLSTLANSTQLFALDHGRFPHSIAYDSREDLNILTQGNEYISNVDIPDPFQRPQPIDQIETDYSGGFGGGAGVANVHHGFVYVNYRDFLNPDIPEYNGIGIYSIGPDRADSWLSLYPLPETTQKTIRRNVLQTMGEQALRPVEIYNPSNGTISEGDFGAFRGQLNGFVPRDL